MHEAGAVADEVDVAERPTEAAPWGAAARIGFRFAFVYLLLCCLPGSGESSVFAGLPWIGERLSELAAKPWAPVWHWVAVHVFHLSGAVTMPHPTGSGDTTLNYVEVFCNLVIAAVGTLLWTALDRRRTQYQTMYALLRLLLRFSLAFAMLGYGFVKIFPLQFQPPELWTLTETYGQSSPMGLLWTFMGASLPYTIFAGTLEATAGTLLLFRRTALLGALMTMGVTLNIVLLNFCYDVPVKLFSLHLLGMATFLTLPYWPSLWDFFILHRTAKPHGVWLPRSSRRWIRVTGTVLQVLVIVSVLASNIWGGYTGYRENYTKAETQPLAGIWRVANFEVGGNGAAPNASIAPWVQMVIGTHYGGRVTDRDGESATIRVKADGRKRTLHLAGRSWPHVADLSYAETGAGQVVLTGEVDHRPATISLERTTERPFLLTTRGFHWISEDPFER